MLGSLPEIDNQLCRSAGYNARGEYRQSIALPMACLMFPVRSTGESDTLAWLDREDELAKRKDCIAPVRQGSKCAPACATRRARRSHRRPMVSDMATYLPATVSCSMRHHQPCCQEALPIGGASLFSRARRSCSTLRASPIGGCARGAPCTAFLSKENLYGIG